MNQILHASKLNSIPLSIERLRELAPSIFAEAPHSSRSAKFAFVPSLPVIEGLMAHGFQPMVAGQSRAMSSEKRITTKHMIRFRHPTTDVRQVGDVLPEIILVNANDGTSSYQLMAGLFRLACLNGLIIADQTIAGMRVPHFGNQERVANKVIEGAFTIIAESVKALEAPRRWSALNMTRPQQLTFAERAHAIRWEPDAEGKVDTHFVAHQLLDARRHEDRRTDLWTLFNVVQENVLRGGVKASWYDASLRRTRRATSLPITGIDPGVKLNRRLWSLAEETALAIAA